MTQTPIASVTAARAAPQHADRAGSWLLRTTLRRTRSQWRLLLAVVAIATLSSGLVTSLGLLVGATEQGGVRGALGSIPATQSTLTVRVTEPSSSVADARAAMDGAVASLLGPAATSTSSGIALTRLDSAPGLGTLPALAYFGELDAVRSHATLVDGAWAGAASADAPVPVTLPAAAGKALGLVVGSSFAVDTSRGTVRAEVAGLYKADHPAGDYWSRDYLDGKGNNSAFPKPDVLYYSPTNAFGPLLVAPGAIDLADIPVAFVDVAFHPDFRGATVDELGPLQERLRGADLAVARRVGDTAGGVFYSSDVADAVGSVASGLVVTRSTVIVVSLLLAVLAVAAMGQTARLFTDARAGEQQLMRSRGASPRHILALAAVEACLIGVVTACLSPPLAALAYRALAAQPPMLAAGMPADAGMPPLSWATSAAIALVFVGILVAPLLRPARTFAESEQAKGRQRVASGLMRSGFDLVIVALAGIAYWQLQSYRTPVDATGPLAVDPVLVAGPALVLLAGALVCARLIPAASRLAGHIGSRARGIALPLAAWEIGRRSQRATAAVLLLSLTLGVGAFSLSFLASWRQSQTDQASVAVGPPVRMPAGGGSPAAQAAALAAGASGAPQPVIRRSGQLSDSTPGAEDGSGGSPVQLLGLTAPARQLIDRGRLSEVGGDGIATLLAGTAPASTGVELPGDARGVSATVRIGGGDGALAGVSATLRAIVEDGSGLLSTIDLGRVDADGEPQSVRGLVPRDKRDRSAAPPLRLVGLQASLLATNQDAYRGSVAGSAADILVKDVAVLHPGAVEDEYAALSVTVPAGAKWFGQGADPLENAPVADDVPPGWQLGLDVVVPGDVQTRAAVFALVGWTPVTLVPAVVSDAFAANVHADRQSLLTVQVGGVAVAVQVVGSVPLIPGAATSTELNSQGLAQTTGAARVETVALDQKMLSHALAQRGVDGAMVDEWWVDVAPGQARAYLAAHKSGAGQPPGRSAEVVAAQLQEAPLRVGTQAALWLAILASVLLAAVGFAVHSTASLRSRRLELAQLRAIGLSRRRLVVLVAGESAMMCVLGTLFGVSIGVLLAWLVGPLIAVSGTGTPPVPSVEVVVPWIGIIGLVAAVAVVLVLVVVIVARVQRFAEPADLLRAGDEQ